jgi:hypothetical protein
MDEKGTLGDFKRPRSERSWVERDVFRFSPYYFAGSLFLAGYALMLLIEIRITTRFLWHPKHISS